MHRFLLTFFLLSFTTISEVYSQDITLFQQFNGRYDYLAIGNTLNPAENNLDRTFCDILPASEADLTIGTNQNIVAAYLYWAGSGVGDLEISLNGSDFQADEVYQVNYNDPNYGALTYFSCYTDITDFVNSQGNTTYEFSNLDVSDVLASNSGYCSNRTNFAGWSIYVVYEDANLPLNQINLFQGLEIINRNVQEKIIILDNINVLDNIGAKIGFLAWEGDSNLAYGESLLINNNTLSNPPLNPSNNAFNGTNTFTNSSVFYNCDLDVYDIQNNINIGDTSVEIKLTTGDLDANGNLQADLIILNNIITVLNSQLPDATVIIDDFMVFCGNRNVQVNYTVFNLNSTDVLPANTPIAFYANNEFIGSSDTQNPLPIGGSESGTILLNIPENIPIDFMLMLSVDDTGNGTGVITELNELNNNTQQEVSLIPFPEVQQLPDLDNCDLGFNMAYFDLTEALETVTYNSLNDVSFYTSLEDLQNDLSEISTPEYYENITSPQTIYIKIENATCYEVYQFNLSVENCPPYIPEVFTPNNDGYNDWFNIQGLYNIFEKHKLLIYNRYGTLIFEGNNDTPWEGKANKGLNNKGVTLPVGTYFYVLYLNDANYKTLTGWVYLNR